MRRIASLPPLVLFTVASSLGQGLSFGSRQARPVPDWLYKSTIYELWLNAFSPEGTLRGAIPGLKQHIADLGANIVYLGPGHARDDRSSGDGLLFSGKPSDRR